MRWLPWFILAYVAIGLQIGLSGPLRWHGASPDFVLIAAVFVALHAPREGALLGCFALGALHDLVSMQSMGLYALSYGLLGLAASGSAQAVYRGHPLTHFALTFLGGMICAVTILVHNWLRLPPPRTGVLTLTWSALYTALVAPLALGALHRLRRIFGFAATRRRVF
ncbi:MAG: rod shape-determining protein MreD [Tepidisphaeraceae bacterium]